MTSRRRPGQIAGTKIPHESAFFGRLYFITVRRGKVRLTPLAPLGEKVDAAGVSSLHSGTGEGVARHHGPGRAEPNAIVRYEH
jgi:hypothetical protein